MDRPSDIGIKAMELYFPNRAVSQAELEKFDEVGEGKYTIGLGQKSMSFCDDREDIYSIALTVVSSLCKKYNVDLEKVGRLEVGTETLLDKSKSVKSVLMQLFPESNRNVEGIDTVNACYGGTNALFNAVNWVESSAWDGRDAIVVACDIAIYSSGAARPTGGCGAVAMLVGPNAPIRFEAGRASCMDHVYDFYKPDLTSEYPIVDGAYSLECYAKALDSCYKTFKSLDSNGHININGTSKEETPLTSQGIADRFDYMCFHSPTAKLVSKSYARLHYLDYLENPEDKRYESIDSGIASIPYDESVGNRTIEKEFLKFSSENFDRSVAPATSASTRCGNMYTASLYAGLSSLISNVEPSEMQDKTIGMFSYGSGLASTLFKLKVVGDISEIRRCLDMMRRLDQREIVSPSQYDESMHVREEAHLQKDFVPKGNLESLAEGTYYLTEIDDKYRRSYAVR